MPRGSSFKYHAPMSSARPKPKSTLSLGKFESAQRVLGSPEPLRTPRQEPSSVMGVGRAGIGGREPASSRLVSSIPMRTRPAPTVAAPTPWVTTVKGAARPTGADTPAPRRKAVDVRKDIERKDQVLVTSLIVACVMLLIGVASLRMGGSMRNDRSQKSLAAQFAPVHTRQGKFRMQHQRFATWKELAAEGAKLKPSQRVVASNASSSHWYLAVEDTVTGITCSRTGELFDEGPDVRAPNCTAPRR